MPADLTGVNWDDCALEKITEMVSRRVFLDREGGATFVQTDLRKGALVALHSHRGEQMIQVVQGSVVVTMNGTTTALHAGQSVTIPAGVPHEVEATADSVVMDVRRGETTFTG